MTRPKGKRHPPEAGPNLEGIEKATIRKLIKLAELLEDVLVDIAEDPRTDKAILRELAYLYVSESPSHSSLMNPNIPRKVLERKLQVHAGTGGTDEVVREHIIPNPALPLKTLRKVIEEEPVERLRQLAAGVLAERLTKSPRPTAAELWDAYKILDQTVPPESGAWHERVKKALLAHPSFPKGRIRPT